MGSRFAEQRDDILVEPTIKEDMNLVIVGHVDHGKSTIIGRLLADTDSLPEGKLSQVAETCQRTSKPFEYAFLLDALKEERSQGITIDAARCFFHTAKRNYLIMDAPGHIEFLKNMVTGASRAEAALLVIDAAEGIKDNTRRHGYLLSFLGIEQVGVLVNKMDLVDYRWDIFNNIVAECQAFLAEVGLNAAAYIPVSGSQGDNIARSSEAMPWYRGLTALELLDSFHLPPPMVDRPFRMPVQDIYKFTANDDQRRIIAGTVESGAVSRGESVVFYPSGKTTRIKSIEVFCQPELASVKAGQAAGFTLDDPLYISRGEIMTRADETRPMVASSIRATVFWLGKQPLSRKKRYILKLATARVGMQLEKVERVMDSAFFEARYKQSLECNEVGECIFTLDKQISFDSYDLLLNTNRFVIIDDYEISGGGLILQGISDQDSGSTERLLLRNYKWEKSRVSRESRSHQYGQQAALVIVSGNGKTSRKDLAKSLEEKLFKQGRKVYYLGMSSLLYGMDQDLKFEQRNNREEHMRRLFELAHILLDAGLIMIVSLQDLRNEEYKSLAIMIPDFEVILVNLDREPDPYIPWNLVVDPKDEELACQQITSYLKPLWDAEV